VLCFDVSRNIYVDVNRTVFKRYVWIQRTRPLCCFFIFRILCAMSCYALFVWRSCLFMFVFLLTIQASFLLNLSWVEFRYVQLVVYCLLSFVTSSDLCVVCDRCRSGRQPKIHQSLVCCKNAVSVPTTAAKVHLKLVCCTIFRCRHKTLAGNSCHFSLWAWVIIVPIMMTSLMHGCLGIWTPRRVCSR